MCRRFFDLQGHAGEAGCADISVVYISLIFVFAVTFMIGVNAGVRINPFYLFIVLPITKLAFFVGRRPALSALLVLMLVAIKFAWVVSV